MLPFLKGNAVFVVVSVGVDGGSGGGGGGSGGGGDYLTFG